MAKKITAIWAQDETRLIGKEEKLPWSLPADLRHFKETTTEHILVMGRVTFDGMGQRALPNRTSIVVTRDTSYYVDKPNVVVLHSVEEVLDWYRDQSQEKILFVIGGGQIFTAFEPHINEIIRTDIHDQYEGDTYFPESFNWSDFVEVENQFYPHDADNPADFTVRRFVKKEK